MRDLDHALICWMSQRNYTDLVRKNLALINLALINGLVSKRSSIVNLNIDTLFIDHDALRVEKFE